MRPERRKRRVKPAAMPADTEVRVDPLAAVRLSLRRGGKGSSDFDLTPGALPPAGRKLRPAAVLVPLVARPGGVEVILTKRASHLAHHPGQIAFPGGKIDPQDRDAGAAALREAQEEIGLLPANVELLGELAPHETVTGYHVQPVVGRIIDPFVAQPEPGEVEEVFSVPLAHLSHPEFYRIERRRWLGETRSYYVIPYGPYYIWGATARMLMALATRMAEEARG